MTLAAAGDTGVPVDAGAADDCGVSTGVGDVASPPQAEAASAMAIRAIRGLWLIIGRLKPQRGAMKPIVRPLAVGATRRMT